MIGAVKFYIKFTTFERESQISKALKSSSVRLQWSPIHKGSLVELILRSMRKRKVCERWNWYNISSFRNDFFEPKQHTNG